MIVDFFFLQTFLDPVPSRSILKKQDDEKPAAEPFVINIPDNISRLDIDDYLRNVQDQRRRGLNYSYNTDDENGDEPVAEKASEGFQEMVQRAEPWNEVTDRVRLESLCYLCVSFAS